MDELGISFSPLSPGAKASAPDQTTGISPQEAIRILSLRVPRTVGAASPIPSALLTAPGAAGFGGGGGGGFSPMPGANIEMILRQLFGQQIAPMGGPSPMGTPAMPSHPMGNAAAAASNRAPAPSVIPGADQRTPRPIGAIEETPRPEPPPAPAPSMPAYREPANPRDRRY